MKTINSLYGHVCYSKEDNEYCIHDLQVDERHRNKGYGSMLINRAVAQIREYSDLPIFLVAGEEGLIQFYEKLGFILTNKIRKEMYYNL